MTYLCEWYECEFSSDDFDTFYGHVREHTNDFYNEIDPSPNVTCLWRECLSDSCENEAELLRHVLFHGYHAGLKAIGFQAQIDANLTPCSLDSQSRNLVPEFPDEFCCEWEQCDVITCCPRYFYRHVEGHTEELQKNHPHDFLSCKWKDCSFASKRRNKLKEHCRTHTHEKCFSCPSCGGLFSNKTKFMDHLRRQNTMESESYQCSHCFKFCASERILRDHMRQHVNHVRCSLCNMTCPTKSALQHHVNFRHSDEKPFSCDICDSSFKSANDLRRHQQTHDPLYNFSCEVENCNYVTKTLQNLRRHYKVNHEGPTGGRYECHICGCRYSRGTGLTKHLKKQHTFRWPAGHTRFRYKEHDDGMYRLQTVRFESVELSQQLDALENNDGMEEDEEGEDCQMPDTNESNHEELTDTTSQENENQLRINRLLNHGANGGNSTTHSAEISADANDLCPSTTHQHLLDMLSQFTTHSQQIDTSNSGLETTTTNTSGSQTVLCSVISRASNAMEQSSSRHDTEASTRENNVTRTVLDLQEAASLLAGLRDSGRTR